MKISDALELGAHAGAWILTATKPVINHSYANGLIPGRDYNITGAHTLEGNRTGTSMTTSRSQWFAGC